ncbi:MAG: hypothetical protein ACI89J_002903 [Hyphomicrobiaceae bacterium]|jgi:hypothetical protein
MMQVPTSKLSSLGVATAVRDSVWDAVELLKIDRTKHPAARHPPLARCPTEPRRWRAPAEGQPALAGEQARERKGAI